jgi:hypothetical protein
MCEMRNRSGDRGARSADMHRLHTWAICGNGRTARLRRVCCGSIYSGKRVEFVRRVPGWNLCRGDGCIRLCAVQRWSLQR